MSCKGDCYDNASVETFFKSLKAGLIWRQKWPTRRQAEAAIFPYIKWLFNTRRRHSYLGGISRLAFEAKIGISMGSAISALLGYVVLRFARLHPDHDIAEAEQAHEIELDGDVVR